MCHTNARAEVAEHLDGDVAGRGITARAQVSRGEVSDGAVSDDPHMTRRIALIGEFHFVGAPNNVYERNMYVVRNISKSLSRLLELHEFVSPGEIHLPNRRLRSPAWKASHATHVQHRAGLQPPEKAASP